MKLFRRSVLKAMVRRKTLAEAKKNQSDDPDNDDDDNSKKIIILRRTLTAVDLVLYGVGSSVGAGIYVLVGLGAKICGPAISLSFLGCGLACILTALSYAEFASRIPVAGSAFTYVYVAFGEFLAWIVGWFLILGYGFTASVVARAWADYTGDFLMKTCTSGGGWMHQTLQRLTEWYIFGGGEGEAPPRGESDYSCSPLSIVIIAVSTVILLRGAKDSSRFNNIMTVLNISVLMLVIVAAVFSGSLRMDNLTPFVPETKSYAAVVQGAGLVFFAFIGFDMVASLSEEVIAPERNMPIGIVGSLIISTLIYFSVALSVVGMAPIKLLGETVPVINALLANAYCTHEQQLQHGAKEFCLQQHHFTTQQQQSYYNDDEYHYQHYDTHHHHPLEEVEGILSLQQQERHYNPYLALVSHIVAFGAIFGLMAGTFTSLMGQPRIFYRMAQDGLLFPLFAKVDPTTHVPSAGIIVTGVVTALLACFVPLDALANLISLGTLMVFTLVNTGVLLLRLRDVLSATTGATSSSSTTSTSTTITETISITTTTTSTTTTTTTPRTMTAIISNAKAMRRENRKKQRTAVYLLLVFTSSLLLVSMTHSHAAASLSIPAIVTETICLVIAIISFGWLTLLPPTWSCVPTTTTDNTNNTNTATTETTTTTSNNATSTSTSTFQCPYAPYVPLGGIACNAFMMGSLPLSAWFFCLLWLLSGVAFYFAYGIKHSVLGKKIMHAKKSPFSYNNDDSTPLLKRKNSNYSTTSKGTEQDNNNMDFDDSDDDDEEEYEMHDHPGTTHSLQV